MGFITPHIDTKIIHIKIHSCEVIGLAHTYTAHINTLGYHDNPSVCTILVILLKILWFSGNPGWMILGFPAYSLLVAGNFQPGFWKTHNRLKRNCDQLQSPYLWAAILYIQTENARFFSPNPCALTTTTKRWISFPHKILNWSPITQHKHTNQA